MKAFAAIDYYGMYNRQNGNLIEPTNTDTIDDILMLRHLGQDYPYDKDAFEIIEKGNSILIQLSKSLILKHFKLNADRDLIELVEQLKNALPKTEKAKLNKVKLNMKPDLGKNLSICFTSEGNKGYWDLATMSMRGVSSCMRWGSEHAPSLIGTILDPYAGMIYITDGTAMKHGEKIIARAVVRFVVDRNKNKPVLVMEPIYTNNKDKIATYGAIFKSFISKAIKHKAEVKVFDKDGCYDDCYNQYMIPLSEPLNAIVEVEAFTHDEDSNFLSYRDSGLEYRNIKKFANPMKVKLT